MKVALVCDWYEPRVGGIELHLQDLARHLTDVGHEVHIVTTTPGTPVVDGIVVHRVDAVLAPRFGFACTPAALRRVADVIRREKFDVVHAHVSIISPVAFAGAQAAQRAGIGTVLTFHSVVPRTRWLAAAANAVLHCSRWNAVFTAVSTRVARDVQPLTGSQPIHVLPNGIDASFWRQSAARGADGSLELVSVMRLNSKKRPLALVRLMQRLENQIGGRPVRLRIIGDGPLRRRLERSVVRHGLGDRIQLLGRRSRAEIRDVFRTSDVFVLPTIRESFGIAALEARASGLPVVAMRASGITDSIEHGTNGLLAGSDNELTEHVLTLLLGDDVRWAMAGRNRTAPLRAEWGAVIAEHLRLYERAATLLS